MGIRMNRVRVAGLGARFLLLSGTSAWSADDRSTESSSKKSKKDAPAADVPDSRVNADAIAAAADPAADNVPVTYVPALYGDHLYILGSSGRAFQPFYSALVSGAYDSHFTGAPASPGEGLFAVSPTIGFLGHGAHSQYLMQYSSTITHLTTLANRTQVFHQGNFLALGKFNHSWGWDLGFAGSYGNEFLLLAPLTFTNLLNIPAVNAQAAIAQLGPRTALNLSDHIGVNWQPTERDRIAFSAFHSYYAVQAPSSHISYVGFSVNYDRKLTHLTTLRSYNNFVRDFRVVPCSYYEGGIGINMNVRPNLRLDFAGGPTIGTTSCATRLGSNFNASMGYQVTHTSTLYLIALQRSNTSVNLPNSQSYTQFSAGYSREMSRSISARLDGGYLYLTNFVVGTNQNTQGYFVAPDVEWRLTRSLSTAFTYRYVSQIVAVSSLSRNQVLLTLTWRPDQNILYKQ